MNARRFRATLAYDGTGFAGFQRQAAGTPSIQEAVEAAIAEATGQRATVTGAGRTDAGVHAEGQVIAFDVAWSHRDEALRNAINARLPDAVALQDIRQQEGFHPRFDAVTRVYRYTVYQSPAPQPLLRHRVWWVPQPLNGQALHDGAALIPGERDFAALGKAPHGDNTVRRVLQSEWDCALAGSGLLWTYTIEANAFLQHMVRRTVSALVHMGRGWLTADAFRDALQRAELLALPLAPPQGLVLAQVTYDESRWSSTGGAAGNHEQAGNMPAGG